MSGPRVTEVLPGLWTAEVSLPDFAVRSVALLGRERMLVFDTLLHPSNMSPFAELAGDRDIVAIYSHADWDHIWGTAGLPQGRGEVVGHSACADRFRMEVPNTLATRRAEEPGVWDDVELIAPTTLFDESLSLDLEPWTLELHHLPGHTRDSIVGWIPAVGVFLGGDTIEQPWPLAGAGLPLDPWFTALREWAARPEVRVVIPSHGDIAGPELLERNADYLTALRDGADYPVPEGTDLFYIDHHAADLRRYTSAPEVGTD